MIILDLFFDVMKTHNVFKKKILELVVGSCIRFKFYTHVIMYVDNKSPTTIIDGLKILISMLKVGKESFNYLTFHKEQVGLLNDLTKIVKGLLVHHEVGIRKNTVHFIVQCYFFFDQAIFAKLLNELSPEQQKLVEIYMKKADN